MPHDNEDFNDKQHHESLQRNWEEGEVPIYTPPYKNNTL